MDFGFGGFFGLGGLAGFSGLADLDFDGFGAPCPGFTSSPIGAPQESQNLESWSSSAPHLGHFRDLGMGTNPVEEWD